MSRIGDLRNQTAPLAARCRQTEHPLPVLDSVPKAQSAPPIEERKAHDDRPVTRLPEGDPAELRRESIDPEGSNSERGDVLAGDDVSDEGGALAGCPPSDPWPVDSSQILLPTAQEGCQLETRRLDRAALNAVVDSIWVCCQAGGPNQVGVVVSGYSGGAVSILVSADSGGLLSVSLLTGDPSLAAMLEEACAELHARLVGKGLKLAEVGVRLSQKSPRDGRGKGAGSGGEQGSSPDPDAQTGAR